MAEDWKKLAEEYGARDWSFSSAFAWKKIVTEDSKPFNLIQYVDQLRLSGNYSDAAKIIGKVNIEEIPIKYQFVYLIRKGMLHDDQGETEEAIECYRKSIQLKPDDTYPYILLGAALSKKRKLDEAEKVFLEALNKEGDIDEVHYNLSLVYARKGDFKKAITAINACLKLDPNFPNAKTWLADFENIEHKLKLE